VAGSPKPKKPSNSLRTGRGKASVGFAGFVLVALLVGTGYLAATGKWDVIAGSAELHYRDWFEGLVNDPGNEEYRTALIAHLVDYYRETPARKSLPLRNEDGYVVGRFRIHVADVEQPHENSANVAHRRIYKVELAGSGELWHDFGGRVRFRGRATVTYQLDFRIQDWTAYCYFTCVRVENARFDCTHIDNLLGQIFSTAVRSAGMRSLTESLEPGFTIIAKPNGETWLAFGHVGKEFQPRKGPCEEHDADCETIVNDASLLHAAYRDYLGPIELHDGDELRVTIETESMEPERTFGLDVYVLTEEQFQRYEQFYPDRLHELGKVPCLDARFDMQKLNMRSTAYTGNIYILADYTGLGSGRDPDNRAEAGLAKYYVRVKR
jgi:hypothetical protein